MTQNCRVCVICCSPEINNDVTSGLAVDNVGMGVPIKFGDSWSNGFRDIWRAHFVERTNRNWPIPIARNATAFCLKTVENTASDGFVWNFLRTIQARIMKFYALIETKRPHKPARNCITSFFWLATKNSIIYYGKVRKTGQKCRKRLITRKWCKIRQKVSVLQRLSRLQI